MSHTAGPWIVTNRANCGWNYRIETALRAPSERWPANNIADVETKDDAILISKAPEMLELLERFLGESSLEEDDIDECPDCPEFQARALVRQIKKSAS